MRSFVVLAVVVVLTATVNGRPQYGSGGGGDGGPECVTKFREISDIVTTEKLIKECKPIIK